MNKLIIAFFVVLMSISSVVTTSCTIKVIRDDSTSQSSSSTDTSSVSSSVYSSEESSSSSSSTSSGVIVDSIYYNYGTVDFPDVGYLIKWTSSLSNVIGYRIYYATGTTVDENSDYVDVSSEYNYYVFTKDLLVLSGTYTFAVVARTINGFSSFSNFVSIEVSQ